MPESKGSILVVEDDRNFQLTVVEFLRDEGYDAVGADSGAQALALCEARSPDLVLLDQKLPDGLGVDFCSTITGTTETAKVIMVTAYPSFDNAVSAIRAGAFDYLTKPVELDELSHLISRAIRTSELETIEQYQRYRTEKESEESAIVGDSPALANVKKLVDLAGRSPANVLVSGETGTGKNLVAKAIHYSGPKRTKPFVSINCAAIPAEMMEAELFGHEKGAFTGAASGRKGIFEMAHGGTLFLDEIGTMPFELQAKLLTVIEDKTIRRLGGQSNIRVETRIVAATNDSPEGAVAEGRLREDLFYRLNVIRIHVPPLRERLEDLPKLCERFLRVMAAGRGLCISKEEMERLKGYGWPGNIRELKNLVERAVTLQEGPRIAPADFFSPLPNLGGAGGGSRDSAPRAEESFAVGEGTSLTLQEMERRYIVAVLDSLGGNIARTARRLEIAESTLRRKLRSFGRG